ncbi:MAG: beta-N-acetylglucosaminidase domain-containing protein [Microthrixaceae bacterium]
MLGIIEGFYGRPWSWTERREMSNALAAAGMDTYVYAPKDDPLHRAEWRTPYPDEVHREFARLVEHGGLRVGFTVSPGLSIDATSARDRDALRTKFLQVMDVGVSLVGVLFDDLEPADGLGEVHGELTSWLRAALPTHVELFVVPLHYTGTSAPPYLTELARRVPEEVAIGWTGRHVVNRTVTIADATAWSAAMAGRRPLLWDNTPVNDALMVDHLFTGPLRGREPGLAAHLHGYLANPSVQPRASLPALLSAAAWCRGEDPAAAWRGAAGADLVVLEGCDGAVPAALATAGLGGDRDALERLEGWFAAAERATVGGLDEAVRPWVDQLVAEAAVGKVAVQLLLADPEEARRVAPLLHVMWPPLRHARHQVLGGRGALLPALGQDEQSRWVASGESFVEPANVVDRLVAALFARLDAPVAP